MNARKITQNDDFEAIGNIYAQSWKTAYRGIIPQEYLDTLNASRWTHGLENGIYDAFVLIEDDRYIGTSSICAARDEKMADYGEIISLYLLPEYFGHGYAAPLLQCAVNALLEKGHKNIYLWVLKENTRAQKFYEKQGFHKNGDTSCIEIAGKELAEIRYVKNF